MIPEDYLNFLYFYEPSVYAEQHLVVSDGMGCTIQPSFNIDRTYFNNNAVMYVLSGQINVEQNGQLHEVKPNQGILIDLKQKHRYYFDKTPEPVMVWFHLRGNPLEDIMTLLGTHKQLPLTFELHDFENDILQLFKATKNTDPAKEFTVSALIYNLFLRIVSPSIRNIYIADTPREKFKHNMDSYITANIDSKFVLNEVASHFGMSRYHFCRQFKQHFGITFSQYIKHKKIDLARKMLRDTNYSIVEISGYLNYYDQGYFSNIFKSLEGCSPLKYRQKFK